MNSIIVEAPWFVCYSCFTTQNMPRQDCMRRLELLHGDSLNDIIGVHEVVDGRS